MSGGADQVQTCCDMTAWRPFPCKVADEIAGDLHLSFNLINMKLCELLQSDLSGHTSLIFLPSSQLLEAVRHYKNCKVRDGVNTAAVFVTPRHDLYRGRPPPPWYDYVKNMQKVREFKGLRLADCQVPWGLEVWYDPKWPLPPVDLPGISLACMVQPAVASALNSTRIDSMIFAAKIAGKNGLALIDSGASAVFLSDKFCQENAIQVQPSTDYTVTLAGNQQTSVVGQATVGISIGMNISHAVSAYVMPELVNGVAIILGVAWMKKYKVDLLYSRGHCVVNSSRKGPVIIQPLTRREYDLAMNGLIENESIEQNGHQAEPPQVLPPLNLKETKRALRRGARPFVCTIRAVQGEEPYMLAQGSVSAAQPPMVAMNNESSGATEPKKKPVTIEDRLNPPEGQPDSSLMSRDRLRAVLEDFHDVFPTELPAFTPKDFGVDHRIELFDGAKTPYKKPYRMTPKELAEAKRQVAEFLEKNILVPSQSPFGAQVFFVGKPDGSLRMVADFRAINAITRRIGTAIPNVQELLDRLQGKKIFSSGDLFSGFYQVGLNPADREKSAINLPFGSYEFTCLPMGMCNSPPTFQAVMNKVFAGLPFVNVYIDDLVVASDSPEEHEEHLNQVFARLRKYKLYCNLKKCHFNQPELKFLGFICGRDGIKVDPAKIKVVQDWPTPKNAKEVQQWLGLTNYFRKFIQGYATLATPLHMLTHKNTPFRWTDEHQTVFEALKHALINAPVLAMPDFSKPFEVVSDASLLGTGAILMQEGRPIAYHSKKFSSAEKNYTTGEQEFLGIIQAVESFRCYLEGTKFTLVTDHNPLTHMDTQPMLSRRQARWVEKLARYEYTWLYRPGRINVADPISRNPSLALVLLSCAVTLRPRVVRAVEQPAQKKTRTQKAAKKLPDPELSLVDRIKVGYANDETFSSPQRVAVWKLVRGLWLSDEHIVVPNADGLRQEIMSEFHEPPLSGHLGMAKTYEAVRRTFYWPAMKKDIEEYVQRCHQCQVHKSSNQRPGGLLQPLRIPERKWEVITMDLITCLPTTLSGHDAIAVFVDKLTKMAHFAPCKTAISAEEFASLYVNEIVRYHGVSRVIVSDRDPRFTGHFLKSVCQLLGVKQSLSTAFHPQSDGQTEIMNRYLQDMLRHYVSPRQDDWDQHLPAAEFAVNNAWHPTLKNTPFWLNYGQHPLTPVTLGTEHVVPSATAFVHDLELHIKEAKKFLQAAQERQKACADKHRREVSFQVGDLVLLSTRNVRVKKNQEMVRKLMPKWLGPLKVLEKVGALALKLELPPHLRMHPVFHVSLVKPYHSDGKYVPIPPMDYLENEPLFKVDALLDSRMRKKGSKRITEYLVRWAGYSPIHDSWEPASNILDPALISEFKQYKKQ